jgi:outer membrane receptor protein involved in Fe transport
MSKVSIYCRTLIILACAATFSATALADTRHRLEIPPGELTAALQAVAKQSGAELIYSVKQIQGIRTNGVKGNFSPETAVSKLLEGTDLKLIVQPSGVLLISSAAAVKASEAGGVAGLRVAQSGDKVASLQNAAPHGGEDALSADEEDSAGHAQPAASGHKAQEIVVTGSHIRGIGASVGSRVDIIDRAEIDRSGFATAEQMLQSLPQNFGGGASEDTTLGATPANNFALGTSVNLRGLGSSSTLLLINGRRVPVAGLNGNFFDISTVPATAIERIEVLPDGSSAVYGADAVAGVVNVILRSDYQGAETRLRYGSVGDGGLQEYQFGQLFGTHWLTGNVLLSVEYYERDSLGNAERDFTADSDLRPLGGDNFSTTFSNPGNILNPATGQSAYAIPAGQDGTALTAGDLLPGVTNFNNTREGGDILPHQQKYGAYASLTQQIADAFELFAEGRAYRREYSQGFPGRVSTLTVPASNPFFVDPFGGSASVLVNYNFDDDLDARFKGDVDHISGVIGTVIDLSPGWNAEIYGSFSEERSETMQTGVLNFAALNAALADDDPATAFNPFGDGSNTNPATLAAIEAGQLLAVNSKVRSAKATFDGPLLSLPGGAVRFALGADYRKERLHRNNNGAIADLEREVKAAFAELYVPLVGGPNRRPGAERLLLSVAGRYENYDDQRSDGAGRDLGSTGNPKVGLLWTPRSGLNVRGSWGTSFRAPDLPTVGAVTAAFVQPLPDPASPSGSTYVIALAGTDPDLRNEESSTWTLGFDFTPQALPELNLNVTYFDIAYNDRISALSSASVLAEEEKFGAAIMRDPSQAQRDAICNDSSIFVFQPPSICSALPIGAIVDFRTRNTARTEVSGFDATLSYRLDTARFGDFAFRVNGSRLFAFREAFSPGATVFDLVSTVHNPVDLRMRNEVTWRSQRGWSATAFINYTDGYRDDFSVPGRAIGSWTTVDLTLGYETAGRFADELLSDMTVRLSLLNVTDEHAPFVNNPDGIGYDPENAGPLGRFVSLNVSKRW